MTTVLSINGLIEIPEEFRNIDHLRPGQRCEIERVSQSEYRLRVADIEAPAPNAGLVAFLQSCPVKGFFEPMERIDTTDDLKSVAYE
jgi:hypothetical protein